MSETIRDHIALDRASVRTTDIDGHMHVSVSTISAAAVNGYLTEEIPDWESLGLTPGREYQLLRPPEELKRAAATFAGKPLLIVHKPQIASEHDHQLVVGAVSNPIWDDPLLKAELVIWDEAAIAAIQSGEQRALSCGYRYRCVVEPGTFNGVHYDAKMVDLVGNHVALVSEPRVQGAFVGDSALPTPTTQPLLSREPRMQFVAKKLSRPALLAGAAVLTHIRPKLAADAKIDVTPIVAKVTAKTWKADKAKIKTALDAALKGKLAADADIEDVIAMLDKLDDAVVEGAADDDLDEAAMDEDDETEEERKERLAKRAAAKAAAGAEDAEEPELKAGVPPTGNKVSKAAMDAAIAAAVKATEKSTISRLNAIHEAYEVVAASAAGKIAVICDSAEAVYKAGLDVLDVDVTGVHPSAYRAILVAQPKPSDAAPKPARLATDAASTERFNTLFPDAPRVKHL